MDTSSFSLPHALRQIEATVEEDAGAEITREQALAKTLRAALEADGVICPTPAILAHREDSPFMMLLLATMKKQKKKVTYINLVAWALTLVDVPTVIHGFSVHHEASAGLLVASYVFAMWSFYHARRAILNDIQDTHRAMGVRTGAP